MTVPDIQVTIKMLLAAYDLHRKLCEFLPVNRHMFLDSKEANFNLLEGVILVSQTVAHIKTS